MQVPFPRPVPIFISWMYKEGETTRRTSTTEDDSIWSLSSDGQVDTDTRYRTQIEISYRGCLVHLHGPAQGYGWLSVFNSSFQFEHNFWIQKLANQEPYSDLLSFWLCNFFPSHYYLKHKITIIIIVEKFIKGWAKIVIISVLRLHPKAACIELIVALSER